MTLPTLRKIVLLSVVTTASAMAATSSALADAAEHRDQAALRALLGKGANVNAAQVDGTTALHWAVYNDDAESAELLIKAGANVNALNNYGDAPLVQACNNANARMMKLLLDAGANPNTTLKGGETALMLAARSGNVESVKMLLARGANANAHERLGQTALMWAAAEGHSAVIRALLDADADINARVDSGFTPFFFAVREGRLDAVRVFLAAGVDVNGMMGRGGRGGGGRTSPLLLAVQNGHFELAIALIDAGADPNDLRTGFAALHMLPGVRKPDSSDGSDGAPAEGAGHLSSLEFVREIVKRGANVNLRLAKDAPRVPSTSSTIASPGATPLLFAADRSDVALMRLLLELGADPLIPNLNNTTPLMAAAGVGTREALEEAGEESEAVDAVKMLLDRGADIDGVDNNGDTAMHGAAYNHYPLVVKLLAEHGAKPEIWNKPNKAGRTPLIIAEGYVGAELRPDPPTVEALTNLMLAAGLSTGGARPAVIDQYRRPVAPPKPSQPEK